MQILVEKLEKYKWILVLLYALNYKGAILVWHARFVWLCFKHTVSWKLLGGMRRSRTQDVQSKDIFRSRFYHGRATLGDLDFNIHKSNSTYFSDADMARTSFSLQHFPDFLIGNLKDHLALGGISCNFTAEIRPYERFVMETKLLCWDDKWIFLSTRFLGPSGKAIDRRAQSLAQYVFKAGRRTIKPEEVLITCGYNLTTQVLSENKKNLAVAYKLMQLSELKELW